MYKTHTFQERFLRNVHIVASSWDFNIGDVLVRSRPIFTNDDGDYDYTIDTLPRCNFGNLNLISSKCPVPKKYKVVYVEQQGDIKIPWVQPISVTGTLGKARCLLIYDPTYYAFEVDPEQANAILLDYKYDPLIEYKNLLKERRADKK